MVWGMGYGADHNDHGNNQHNPQYTNYWAPLTRKWHPMPHPAQPRHTDDGAPRTRKRHQQEHRPQRPTERSDPTQHAKGRTGDCPGPCKETTTRRHVTGYGVWGVWGNGRTIPHTFARGQQKLDASGILWSKEESSMDSVCGVTLTSLMGHHCNQSNQPDRSMRSAARSTHNTHTVATQSYHRHTKTIKESETQEGPCTPNLRTDYPPPPPTQAPDPPSPAYSHAGDAWGLCPHQRTLSGVLSRSPFLMPRCVRADNSPKSC